MGRILGKIKAVLPLDPDFFVTIRPAVCLLRFFTFSSPSIHAPLPMKTKYALESADVAAIVAAAETEALKNKWAVVIAVVDDGGHLWALKRLDGVAPISTQIAPGKARTAALGCRETRIYEEMINGGRFSFLSAPGLEGMLEGGVPILKDGHCIGAVGVSGVKSAEDAQVARAGIAALGL
jgi:glc operon protein GlcG